MNLIITLYFVGETQEEARSGLVFESYESADSYRLDQGAEAAEYLHVYSVSQQIDLSNLTEVSGRA